MALISISRDCIFTPDGEGGRPYTGAVVLSPGPGMPLGISAASACGCCRSDQRSYIIFKDGKVTSMGMVEGKTAVDLTTFKLLKGANTYYKVGYLPGTTTVGGCCKCIAFSAELRLPETLGDSISWCEAFKTLVPMGTTARSIEALAKEVAKLRDENANFRKRLGLPAASGGAPAPTTPEEKATAALIDAVLASVGDCGC